MSWVDTALGGGLHLRVLLCSRLSVPAPNAAATSGTSMTAITQSSMQPSSTW